MRVRRWDLGQLHTFRYEEVPHCHRSALEARRKLAQPARVGNGPITKIQRQAPEARSEVSPARKGWENTRPHSRFWNPVGVTRRLRHSNTSVEMPYFLGFVSLVFSQPSRTFAPPALWLRFAYFFPALADWANFSTRLRRCGLVMEAFVVAR